MGMWCDHMDDDIGDIVITFELKVCLISILCSVFFAEWVLEVWYAFHDNQELLQFRYPNYHQLKMMLEYS